MSLPPTPAVPVSSPSPSRGPSPQPRGLPGRVLQEFENLRLQDALTSDPSARNKQIAAQTGSENHFLPQALPTPAASPPQEVPVNGPDALPTLPPAQQHDNSSGPEQATHTRELGFEDLCRRLDHIQFPTVVLPPADALATLASFELRALQRLGTQRHQSSAALDDVNITENKDVWYYPELFEGSWSFQLMEAQIKEQYREALEAWEIKHLAWDRTLKRLFDLYYFGLRSLVGTVEEYERGVTLKEETVRTMDYIRKRVVWEYQSCLDTINGLRARLIVKLGEELGMGSFL